MKTGFVKPALVLALALTAGCGPRREAGSQIDEGRFGNPTMNNTLIQNGEKTYTRDLAGRFASEVPTMINFAFNSAQLDSSAISALQQQANWIKQFPEVRFLVYGHTDLVGGTAANKRLGLRRARAVVDFFVRQGISRSRLEAIVSFGKTRPLIVTDQPERRNRRTVTEVSGFVQSHPMVLNGKYAAIIFRKYAGTGTPGGSGG
jgi:outer membrane protein OmpA-like peptidoglycan-associated protein